MNADLGGNALATICEGNKVVAYDRELSKILGYTGAMGVIGHEVGHHLCGHLHYDSGIREELEADAISGAVMKNAGYSIDDALKMVRIFSMRETVSHPDAASRASAIASGWMNPEAAKSACK